MLFAVMLALCVQPGRAAAGPQPVTSASPHFAAVSASQAYTCALQADGDVSCWGFPYNGASVAANVKGPFSSVTSGQTHACAVRVEGSVDCWGGNGHGEAPATVDGTFMKVAVGNGHTCGLERNRDISCWGDNEFGQAPQHVAGPFKDIGAGAWNTCGLSTSGDISCWGDTKAAITGPFTALSTGSPTCAVAVTGDVSCWVAGYQKTPSVTKGPFLSVSADEHTCAVRVGGDVSCWGNNKYGQAPATVTGPFDSVSAGSSHTCAIRTGDVLSCWGDPSALPSPPTKPASDPAVADEGRFFKQEFYAESTSPVTFAAHGTLPDGLSFTSDGTLSGVPARRGLYTFTVEARNLFGAATSVLTLRVLPPPWFDVNADGIADLPVGSSGENVGKVVDAGTVTVLLGSGDGTFGKSGAVLIDQESVGEKSERGDRFGYAITTAEVTGDNYADLIIGAPGENGGAGQVVVVHGSPTGLGPLKRTVLRQGLKGAAGTAERGDGFGTAVSVGDGLWVGAPGEDLGRARNAGVASRFPIWPLRTAGSAQYRQGARGIPGKPETGDQFGAALAGGGTVIGAPGEDVGRIVDAGSVTWKLEETVVQDGELVPGIAERGDRFGASVASAVVSRLDEEDEEMVFFNVLAVGAPGEDVHGAKDAGSVMVGWDFEVNDDGDSPWPGIVQSTGSGGEKPENGDRFGTSVSLAPDGSRLVVGAPGEDLGSVKDSGVVQVWPLSLGCGYEYICSGGIERDATLVQGRAGVPGHARTGSLFGAAVAERPGPGASYIIGAPGRRVGTGPAGGSVTAFNPGTSAQELTQDSRGIPGTAEKGDRFATLPRT